AHAEPADARDPPDAAHARVVLVAIARARPTNAAPILSSLAASFASFNPPGSSNASWADGSENMSGCRQAPVASSGMRMAQRPRLPPTCDGDAERSIPGLPFQA